MRVISRPAAGDMIRRLLLAWLLTGAIQYTCLPAPERVLSGFSALTGQSFPLLLVGTAASFALLTLAGLRWRTAHWERAALLLCFGWQLVLGLCASWSVPLLCAGLVVLALLLVYAAYGARTDAESLTAAPACTGRRAGLVIAAAAAAVFLAAVLALTVFRVLSYAAPTYDFGIFSQMFHSMRTTGLPVTTCERDRVLSHFAVHVSPIYYLFLPFYALFPSPVTLEVLQALLLASAVIPLWRIARRHGLSGVTAGLLCALLLLWPAYAGGTSYDVHENKFLTPLLLWLFDFLDRRCVWGIALFSVLTCMVKEDAPVYVAVIALWVILRALTRTGAERRWGLLTGGAMLVGAVGYFLGVTAWLAADGDGVMSYRYSNFLYDGSDSLFTVIKAVLLSPVRTLFECAKAEKLPFFFLTMGPLLFLPLCTRRYERLVLLIPFLLVNLMSDYTYQHSIFFQYTYGSAACLFYLTAVNLAELPRVWNRPALAATAALLAGVCFCGNILPLSENYVNRYFNYRAVWQETDAVLDRIPDDASVTATTFLTVPLSRRAVLYDLRYCSQEHLLSTDYVVVDTTDSGSLKPYAVDGGDGLDGLTALLRAAGYAQLPGTGSRLQLWKRP